MILVNFGSRTGKFETLGLNGMALRKVIYGNGPFVYKHKRAAKIRAVSPGVVLSLC